MMKLLKWYLGNLRLWQRFKKFPAAIRAIGRWPSETYMKYPPYADFEGRHTLNFGCGKSVYVSPNVVNLDVVPGPGINVVCTENKLPFDDNTFDFVIANHVLEHVPNWFESFKEMARVVKPGGTIEVWIPPVSSDSAFTYRDHLNRIGMQSFAGCATMSAAGANALAAEEFKAVGAVAQLEMVGHGRRSIITWWTMLAWPSLLSFICSYLRNTVSEEQFIFRKRLWK